MTVNNNVAGWQIGDTLLDLYQITDILGEGGFGRVYKVHHPGIPTERKTQDP